MADELQQLTDVEREGLAWADRIAADFATAEDYAAFEIWCARSPQHMAAYRAAMDLQLVLGFTGEAAREVLRSRPLRANAPVLTNRRAFLGGGAIAAGVTAYFMYNPPLDLWPSVRKLGATFKTARTETKTVALGRAKVEFDRATTATMNNGQLQLIEGAALVDASSLDRLDVSSDDGIVTARRASLNLSRLDDVNCLTCLSGDVDLIHTSSRRKLRLTAGQQARYSAHSIDTVMNADLDSVLAWRRGFMVFSETPLVDVLRQINHYRGGRILLTNAALTKKPFTGVFEIGDFDHAIYQISLVIGAKVSALPGGIVLMG